MSFAFRDLTISLEQQLCPTASAGCGEATRLDACSQVTRFECGQATAGIAPCSCGVAAAGVLLACTCTIATVNGGAGRVKAGLELLREQLRSLDC